MIEFIFGKTIYSIVTTIILICAFLFVIIFNLIKKIKRVRLAKQEQEKQQQQQQIKSQYYQVRYFEHGIQASSNKLPNINEAISAKNSMLMHNVTDLKIVFVTEINGKIVSEEVIDK